jgi:hypothetical protein
VPRTLEPRTVGVRCAGAAASPRMPTCLYRRASQMLRAEPRSPFRDARSRAFGASSVTRDRAATMRRSPSGARMEPSSEPGPHEPFGEPVQGCQHRQQQEREEDGAWDHPDIPYDARTAGNLRGSNTDSGCHCSMCRAATGSASAPRQRGSRSLTISRSSTSTRPRSDRCSRLAGRHLAVSGDGDEVGGEITPCQAARGDMRSASTILCFRIRPS